MRNYTYSVRITTALRDLLNDASKKVGVEHNDMVRAAMAAICDYVKKHKSITLPFKLIPQPEFEAMQARIAELEAQLKITGSNICAPVLRNVHISGVTRTAKRQPGATAKIK